MSDGRTLRGEQPSRPCASSRPHLAVHLRQELVQKFLPVLLLSAHLGHQFLHHVVQLLGGGVKLDPAHFGRQGALVCFLPEIGAEGVSVPPGVCPIPSSCAGGGGDRKAPGVRRSLHRSPSPGDLGQLFPSPASLDPGTAPGDPQDRGKAESAMLSGGGGQDGMSLGSTPGALGLLTSMSFCFCRWSSMRLLVVMLSFSQSPWTCRMALCT